MFDESIVENILSKFSANPDTIFLILMALSIWAIPWKGWALWRAARLQQKWWFIALLLVNTVGIFEILYLFVFSKMTAPTKTPTPPPPTAPVM
ncbi:MAG: Membrane protein [Parcubacteria group bacterium GW2011_GWD1_42_9]|nr:MAG: Membrane protein [Parcubacteria group bacterium GW2011_GWA2_42_80]KKS78278.1 MAG: Membrane protein [Parcubacteria group bacterium GW2011_GWD1_42_9]HCM45847.1 hypothetical protein [Candidatus Veblenbacteria bacterium]